MHTNTPTDRHMPDAHPSHPPLLICLCVCCVCQGGRYGTGYEIMALFAANSTRGNKGSGKGTSNGKCEPPSGVGAGEAWVLLQRLVRQHMPCLGDMSVLYGRPMTLGHLCRLTQQAIKKGILTYEDK